MAAAAPPQLSGLAKLLLRRPPSLRELVTLVGYADDYAWFTGLVRRLFPQEAEAALAAPDVRGRVERFANLFGERHFPLYAPFFEFFMDEGDEPPWTWLRKGIPFDLMGFGYDGLHEMWDGYREGFSALVLLARPPDSSYMADDGIRVAWLESAAARIPQETLLRIPQGGIPLDDLAEVAPGDRLRGGGPGRFLGLRRDRQLLPRPLLRRRHVRGLRRPVGGRHHRGGHGGVAQGHRPHGRGGQAGRLAGGGPSRPLRRDAGRHPGAAPQSRTGGKRK